MAVVPIFTYSPTEPYESDDVVFTQASTGLPTPGEGQALKIDWTFDGGETVRKNTNQTISEAKPSLGHHSMLMQIILTETEMDDVNLGEITHDVKVRALTHDWDYETSLILAQTVGWVPEEDISGTWKEDWLKRVATASGLDVPPAYDSDVQDQLESLTGMSF